ncbi:hypothetical protein RND81_12G210100 [Saponaria officinalis]|uniref:3-deoxy-manno-octulosonate cytidylyltransferase n=1 Tax=Saponaria officinalis TaxID=3572 RepID=A0AAW1HDI9_SAPOF
MIIIYPFQTLDYFTFLIRLILFQGKPLVDILGKPMIQRTWERAKLASMLDQVVATTDDYKFPECCRGFGADVIMTSESCQNGAERCSEAVQKLGKKYDVVNIQGDEPLIEPEIIDGIVKALQSRSPSRRLQVFSKAGTPSLLQERGIYPLFIWKRPVSIIMILGT